MPHLRPAAVFRFLVLCLLLLAAPWLQAAEDGLLDADQAFPFSARMVDATSIEARFDVADGYYLYKARMRFAATGARLGTPVFPAAEVKNDEFLGRTEIFHGPVRILIPVSDLGADGSVSLTASFQGCAERGVCYPPQELTLALQVPDARAVATAMATDTQSPELIDRLKDLAGESAGGIVALPPEEAFRLSLAIDAQGRLSANFTVAPQHYLYRDKIKLTVHAPPGVTLVDLGLPEAEIKEDPNLGPMHVYHRSFVATARLGSPVAAGTAINVAASYQGCSEQGICYPPIEQVITAVVGAPPPSGAAKAPENTSESGQIAALLQSGDFWLIVVSFFGFGLLLALTPCVFPMIPILSGIIVGHGQLVTKRRGFVLSLSYVLGMAITYALAGVAAGLSGTLISTALQNPIFLGLGAAIFVGLAFSMFGFYEMQLPSFLQSRFTEASNRIKGGNLTSVFIMGAISALIVGPCVAAPLAGALLYISQTRDTVLGGVSLFFLALGMGVPLLLVGLSAGALLPRAGGWMEAVKKFFGVLLLAVAIWLVAPLFPVVVQLLAWAALLIISGVYLHALDPLPAVAGGWQRFWKGIGLISLLVGGALLLGALGGGRDILQPLAVFKGGPTRAAAAADAHLSFRRVSSPAELDAAIQAANGRFVMLDFYADWCISCKEMERFTFSDARVQARLKDVVLLQADVTRDTPDDRMLLQRYKLFGPPGIIFFDRDGKELAFRVIGNENVDKFLASLDKAIP